MTLTPENLRYFDAGSHLPGPRAVVQDPPRIGHDCSGQQQGRVVLDERQREPVVPLSMAFVATQPGHRTDVTVSTTPAL